MPVSKHLRDDRQQRTFKSIILSVVVTGVFLVLLLRLFQLQVLEAETNVRLSKENRMQLHILKAARGRILDRNGVELARNRPSYSVFVLPYKLHNSTTVIERLCQIRSTNGDAVFDSLELVKQFHRARFRRFEMTRLKEDISFDLVSIIEEHSIDLPGIVVDVESRREYPFGPACFHVLGYMSEIPESQFDSLKQLGYLYGDMIGKSGLERQYESVFRGVNGQEYVEVNAYGKRMGRIAGMPHTDPVAGDDMYVSLDARLQAKAYEAFPDSLKGAVAALDPRSGEVLVIFSSPTADPNIFSQAATLRSRGWGTIAMDSDLPLNNRAIAGTYAPGSTFKLVSALAALGSGKFTIHSHMPTPCTGAYRIGRRIAHCWLRRGHGSLDMEGAIRQSCNIFFYQVGLALGDSLINSYATMVGLGRKTGIDLPGEKEGYLSGEEAHNRRFANRIKENPAWAWTRGLLADLAIGQQQVLTPLQLARMAGTIANGKVLCRPHLLVEQRDASGAVTRQQGPQLEMKLNFNEEWIAGLREAMYKVTQPGGTARRSRVPGIRVGGKTGSAENPQGDLTHSLFVGAAPVDSPRIAIAVVAENAGHGSSVAAPIAGKILRRYFELYPSDTARSAESTQP